MVLNSHIALEGACGERECDGKEKTMNGKRKGRRRRWCGGGVSESSEAQSMGGKTRV